MAGRPVLSGIRLGGSGGSINAALRSVRQAAGLSLDTLATRSNFSKPYLSNVEAGRRRVTVEIAEAYDAAIGTGGLLVRLLSGVPDVPVGRAAELSELHRCAADLAAGRGRAVWVEGEPGIGKSALLRAGLTGPGTGFRTVWAAADESLARFPLWVLLDRVRAASPGPGSGPDAEPDPELAEIAALLSGGSVGVGTGDAVVAAAERLVMLVERWCAASPVLLVLDDLQWADEMSLSVWGRLRRLVGQLPLLLAASCRPVPRRAEVLALRRTVEEPDALLMTLGPLSRDAVTQLTDRLAGAPAGPRLRTAAEQAGGNPLYLRELVDALHREERIRVVEGGAELTADDAPHSLADAIGTRLDFLPDRTRTVLRMAALLGPEPRVEELSAVTGRPASELADLLDEAITAGVLTATGGRMAFRHGLIRTALYEQIPPALRTALHRQVARALATAGTGVEAVAEHLLVGADDTDGTGRWVVDWLSGGAAAALVARAPRAALELLDRVPGADRAALAGYRIAALSVLGRDDDVIRTGPVVLAGATDGETVGRTAWTLAYSLGRAGRLADGRTVIAQVLGERELDRVWRARLRACDAILARDHAAAARAIDEAEWSGDRFALGYALHAKAFASHFGRPDEAGSLACIDRALEVIGDRPETADLRCLLLRNRALGLLNLGRCEEVPAALGAALEAAERSGTVSRHESVRTAAAGTYYDLGRWDDALAELAALADPVARDPGEYWIRRACAALIAVHRDDRAALAAALAALPEDPDSDALPETAGRVRVARALSFEAAGRPAEALDAILRACRRPGSPPDAPDLLYDCQPAVPDLVRLALAVGRRADAEAYVRAVEARAGSGLPEAVAVVRHCRGLLDADPDLVGAAVDGYDRIGFVLQRALAHEDHAVLLARRGDLDGAWAAYEAAADTYVALEAAWDLRRAAERLRPFGVRRGRYRVRRRPSSGWEALTPTELKVAALVAQGLSNPDAAARLQVSRRTVETHVAHIISKLGGRSRTDIVLAYDRRTGVS